MNVAMRQPGTPLAVLTALFASFAWQDVNASCATFIDQAFGLGPGHTHGSQVILRSPSDSFQHEWIRSADSPRRIDLYAGDRYVSSYPLPWDHPRLQYLLDDGTYVAIENWDCTESGITRSIIALSSSGQPLWQTDIESLLPETFTELLTSSWAYASPRSWMLSWTPVELHGTDIANAKLLFRLSNYDQLEITLADGTGRYIRVDDLGDDADAWFARGESYDHGRNDAAALQHYLKVLEIDPRHRPAIQWVLDIYERQDRDDLVEAHLRKSIADNPVSDLSPAEIHSMKTRLGSTQGHPVLLQLRLAELLIRKDRPNAALAALDTTLAHIPNEWQTRVARANLLLNDSNRDEIRIELAKVLEFHLTAIASSSDREADKATVAEYYREAFSDWLASHSFSAALTIP